MRVHKPKVYRITEKYGKYYPELQRKFLWFIWWARFRQDQYYGKPVICYKKMEEAKEFITTQLYDDAPPEIVWQSNQDEIAEKALLDE
jgi:hypothetical protein